MPGSELRGTGRAATYPNSNKGYKKGGRIKAAHGYNTGRENLLEEEGRIDAEKMKTRQKKMDVYKALPEGHPERIALQAELEIGKKGKGVALRGGGVAKKGKGVAL